jgi:hypothetical protein
MMKKSIVNACTMHVSGYPYSNGLGTITYASKIMIAMTQIQIVKILT